MWLVNSVWSLFLIFGQAGVDLGWLNESGATGGGNLRALVTVACAIPPELLERRGMGLLTAVCFGGGDAAREPEKSFGDGDEVASGSESRGVAQDRLGWYRKPDGMNNAYNRGVGVFGLREASPFKTARDLGGKLPGYLPSRPYLFKSWSKNSRIIYFLRSVVHLGVQGDSVELPGPGTNQRSLDVYFEIKKHFPVRFFISAITHGGVGRQQTLRLETSGVSWGFVVNAIRPGIMRSEASGPDDCHNTESRGMRKTHFSPIRPIRIDPIRKQAPSKVLSWSRRLLVQRLLWDARAHITIDVLSGGSEAYGSQDDGRASRSASHYHRTRLGRSRVEWFAMAAASSEKNIATATYHWATALKRNDIDTRLAKADEKCPSELQKSANSHGRSSMHATNPVGNQ
ncbi:hypothetical protein BXZ70DRAFT_911418 [Cristinia sonorae]|uniref:Uncharacterized protein n=1 Tax=Cristinia sonorae TaxID=1940300 RepID=A0A8K0XJR6_9AGAR|nr:hypothetical protein BXZ70DRAFT_911418 [Cristinia sonorae]